MGSGAAGQPMNANTSWLFSSTTPRVDNHSSKHDIDLYVEPSPRDSPNALPKFFTTLEPVSLEPARTARVEETATPSTDDAETSYATPAREVSSPLPADGTPARDEPEPARTVEFSQTSGVADVEFFFEDDTALRAHEPMTYDEVMSRRRPSAPAPANLVPGWLSDYWS